jgi:hypothetical protein
MKAAWEIFDYELSQLHMLLQVMEARHHFVLLPHHIANAIVESAIMHLRIVMEMLREKSSKSDDYVLADLLGPYEPRGLPALRKVYEEQEAYQPLLEEHLGGDPAGIAPNLKLDPKTQIDKLMIHPTKKRTTSHDWTPILMILAPRLRPVLQDLHQHAVRWLER